MVMVIDIERVRDKVQDIKLDISEDNREIMEEEFNLPFNHNAETKHNIRCYGMKDSNLAAKKENVRNATTNFLKNVVSESSFGLFIWRLMVSIVNIATYHFPAMKV